MSEDLYLGFDLSTQQLKAVVVRAHDLKLVHEAKVDFDEEYQEQYGIKKGVLSNPKEGEIYMPVAMWLEAIDLVLVRLRHNGFDDFSKIKGLSGAGMQHGTVFWSEEAGPLLGALKPGMTLVEQLVSENRTAFSHPHSPNWQDASTQKQCDAFDACLGSPEVLAEVTGSKAHHRFSGPQIMRFREKYPSHYHATSRISLVSSFLSSVFFGRFAPIDIGDVCGANLWDIKKGVWHQDPLSLAAGGPEHANELRRKLGNVSEDGGGSLGNISSYFVDNYGFSPGCQIAPASGDNPSTILSLPLRAGDAMVSLGTSTTFLMSTPKYQPNPAYHFMNHPTTAGLYMFMLCYKNGSLAREQIRDRINASSSSSTPNSPPTPNDWTAFNTAATTTPPLGIPVPTTTATRSSSKAPPPPAKLGLYFPRHEIVPNIPAGQWNFTYSAAAKQLLHVPDNNPPWKVPRDHARAIVESQMLSLRLRSQNLVASPRSVPQAEGIDGASNGDTAHTDMTTTDLPPQPRRIYLVGGASVNPAIAQICGEVLGGAEGVYRLELGGNACALGAAYKAVWAREREVCPNSDFGRNETNGDGDVDVGRQGGEGKSDGEGNEEGDDKGLAEETKGGNPTQTFESLIQVRWRADDFLVKVDPGYRAGVFERYGEALVGFEEMEERVIGWTEGGESGEGDDSSVDGKVVGGKKRSDGKVKDGAFGVGHAGPAGTVGEGRGG